MPLSPKILSQLDQKLTEQLHVLLQLKNTTAELAHYFADPQMRSRTSAVLALMDVPAQEHVSRNLQLNMRFFTQRIESAPSFRFGRSDTHLMRVQRFAESFASNLVFMTQLEMPAASGAESDFLLSYLYRQASQAQKEIFELFSVLLRVGQIFEQPRTEKDARLRRLLSRQLEGADETAGAFPCLYQLRDTLRAAGALFAPGQEGEPSSPQEHQDLLFP